MAKNSIEGITLKLVPAEEWQKILKDEIEVLRLNNKKLRKEILELKNKLKQRFDLLPKNFAKFLRWWNDYNGMGYELVEVYKPYDDKDDVCITLKNRSGVLSEYESQELCAYIKEDVFEAMQDRMEFNEFEEARALFDLYQEIAEWWE